MQRGEFWKHTNPSRPPHTGGGQGDIMGYKPRSEDEAEYPQSGMMTEQDIKMAHWSTRQYWADQDRGEDLQAWGKYWKEKHPEWFPDKDGLPWDEYWKKFWSNANKEDKR